GAEAAAQDRPRKRQQHGRLRADAEPRVHSRTSIGATDLVDGFNCQNRIASGGRRGILSGMRSLGGPASCILLALSCAAPLAAQRASPESAIRAELYEFYRHYRTHHWPAVLDHF